MAGCYRNGTKVTQGDTLEWRRAAVRRREGGWHKMRDMRDSDSVVSVLGAIVIVAVIVVLVAGGFYLHKRMQRADVARQHLEQKRAADPAKMLRDAQRKP